MRDVLMPAGIEVVNAQDLAFLLQQPFAEMRAEEAGAAGDKNAFSEHGLTARLPEAGFRSYPSRDGSQGKLQSPPDRRRIFGESLGVGYRYRLPVTFMSRMTSFDPLLAAAVTRNFR
jgi:hypothetical protein